jgi:hypothetical protein
MPFIADNSPTPKLDKSRMSVPILAQEKLRKRGQNNTNTVLFHSGISICSIRGIELVTAKIVSTTFCPRLFLESPIPDPINCTVILDQILVVKFRL